MGKTTLCMNPGPIEFDKRVLRQMSHKGISHVDGEVISKFKDCLSMMYSVFLAKSGQPMIVSGSGTLGWDMTGANLVSKGDEVLVVNTGYFGDNFGTCLERYGAKITHLRAKQVGDRPSKESLKAALEKKKYKLVTITHVDTSTGVLADVQGMAKLIRSVQSDALIVVDGVCALGGEECRMTDWDLDVVITGSQKCIGVPAGLSLLMISERALQVFKLNPSSSSYYCDWNNWLPIMTSYQNGKPSYFATPAVNHIYALHTAFEMLLENGGMEARFLEHSAASNAIKDAITAIGCSQVPKSSEMAATTMTCVRYPAGVKGNEFLPKVSSYGVSLAGGLHKQIKTEYFRIGHLGPSTRRLDHLVTTITAIEKALADCGHSFQRGAGVAKIKALKGKVPGIKTGGSCCSFQPLNPHQGCPCPPACQALTIAIVSLSFVAGWMISSSRNNR